MRREFLALRLVEVGAEELHHHVVGEKAEGHLVLPRRGRDVAAPEQFVPLGPVRLDPLDALLVQHVRSLHRLASLGADELDVDQHPATRGHSREGEVTSLAVAQLGRDPEQRALAGNHRADALVQRRVVSALAVARWYRLTDDDLVRFGLATGAPHLLPRRVELPHVVVDEARVAVFRRSLRRGPLAHDLLIDAGMPAGAHAPGRAHHGAVRLVERVLPLSDERRGVVAQPRVPSRALDLGAGRRGGAALRA